MTLTFAFLVDSVPFTKDIVAGTASLGGSESACVGLARALKARGHEVYIFATKLDDEAAGLDHAGVRWHHVDDFWQLNTFLTFDVVCALRQYGFYARPINARLKLLWNQDMLVGDQAKHAVMSLAWAFDRALYVSAYQRKQWEGMLPELKDIGHVIKNGFDASLVPQNVEKQWNRIIHISRPERGLEPLLAMWPELKKRVPKAELHICRYQSMYDGEGSNVKAMCEAFDAAVQRINREVGGITWLGSLGKPELYKAIAEAAVMWYPGIASFAETSCIAAIEAQANGTPLVLSWKGALPETAPHATFIPGDALTKEYQEQSIQAVVDILNTCKRKGRLYRETQDAGRKHVQSYTYEAIAAEFDEQIHAWFRERFEWNKLGVLRQLLHEDDHTAALKHARNIISSHAPRGGNEGELREADEAVALCQRVIAGKEQTAEQYAAHAIQEPMREWEYHPRMGDAAQSFKGCTNVLDVACGNGAFAVGLAKLYPELKVTGVDYAQGNIELAKRTAEEQGVADRCRFFCAPVWDFDRQDFDRFFGVDAEDKFDGLFVGEFLEHVADAAKLIDGLEPLVQKDALVCYTMPFGPFGEMLDRHTPRQRGHVHHFHAEDLVSLFSQKTQFAMRFLSCGQTQRGSDVGHWIVTYRAGTTKAGQRDYDKRIQTIRPKRILSVGMMTQNAEADLARCLTSIWNIADEIVIADAGSKDRTREIAKDFGARVIDVPTVYEHPDGFAGIRNECLKATTGDWFLWIDSDEVLLRPHEMWKYLYGHVYNGFALRQNHLQVDCPMTWDEPVRVFRKSAPIQFYGAIHEQPQMGDCNGDIIPTLLIRDVEIAHTGYMAEDIRLWKMRERNLPLLQLDTQRFPDRELGKVLVLRDLVNLADLETKQAGGVTPNAQKYYRRAVALFEKYLADPSNKFYGKARPWYESALRVLGMGWEMEVGLSGKFGGMGQGRARPERIWVRDYAQFDKHVAHRMAQEFKARMEPTATDVEPIAPAPEPKTAGAAA